MDRKKNKHLDFDYIVSSVAGYAKVAPIARKVKAGDEMAIARAAGTDDGSREECDADGQTCGAGSYS